MKEYHKIQTVWLRDPNNNYKTLLEEEWSKPEFKFLEKINWICTEKIDGTNIRIMWNGKDVSFGGKTDKAQIPKHLLSMLQEKFTNEFMEGIFQDTENVCMYGEGYGMKIQKGGNYIPDKTNFILFDIKIGNWWLTRDSIESIAEINTIDIVPIIKICTLTEAIKITREGYKSIIAHNKEYNAEGLICKPTVELFNRKGERVITKIKSKDFKD
jgi:hypothetical protein